MFNRKNFFKIWSTFHKFGQGKQTIKSKTGKNNQNISDKDKREETPNFDFNKFQIYDSGDTSTDCGCF